MISHKCRPSLIHLPAIGATPDAGKWIKHRVVINVDCTSLNATEALTV